MRYGIHCFALALSLVAAGCSDESPVAPDSDLTAIFTANLLPANEVPPVSNADRFGSGTVTITMHLTKDASGNITAANADFVVILTAFPANIVLTGAHIHQAAAGTNAGVLWNTGLLNGEVTFAGGAGTFSKLAVTAPSLEAVQAIINNPAGFYFNVHSTINTGGCARGQLVRTN